MAKSPNGESLRLRNLDKNEDHKQTNRSSPKANGLSPKANNELTIHGSPKPSARSGSTVTKRTSVAELGKMSATHINYCSRRYRIRKVLRKFLVGLFVFVYVVLPVFYWKCTWVRRNIIYLNVAFATKNLTNIDNPVLYGNFSCARNLYLSSEKGISLGTWHVMPNNLVSERCCDRAPKYLDENEFRDDKPIIFHFHGSGGSRGERNRINLIKILTNQTVDCHVVTMDYRGFGESTPADPSVELVTNDVREVYRWLRIDKNVSNERIFFYGQSLGTGIATHLAHDSQTRMVKKPDGTSIVLGSPAAIVLEAPYTDIAEASRLHPYTYFHAYYPFFERFFIEPIRHSDTFFDSQSRIGNITSPVLILHAVDDDTIPYVLGKRLYEVAKANRDPVKQPVDMVTYDKSLDYGHKKIYSDPGFPNLIKKFIWNNYKIGKTLM